MLMGAWSDVPMPVFRRRRGALGADAVKVKRGTLWDDSAVEEVQRGEQAGAATYASARRGDPWPPPQGDGDQAE